MVRAQRSLMRVVSHWGICSDPLQLKYIVVLCTSEANIIGALRCQMNTLLNWNGVRRGERASKG